MPLTNWPPISYPTWPPQELQTNSFEACDLITLIRELQHDGFSLDTPTPTENNTYFKAVKCDEGHNIIGRMLVSPSGIRFPFAVCTNSSHRQLLVLWGPNYCMGAGSGNA